MANLRAEFLDHFPDSVLQQIVKELTRSYHDAPRLGDAAGLDQDHNRWNWPLLRRALFEQRLYEVAAAHGAPLAARKEFVGKDNTPYTVISSGPFFLTTSHVDQHGALPRKCGFRKGNSSHNYSLFAELSDCTDPTRYAILAHGSSANGRELKWFEAIFPDASYQRVAEKVDLLSRYNSESVVVPVAPVATPVVQVPDEAQPKLKRRTAQKRKAE